MNLHLWRNKGAPAPAAAPRGVNDLANTRRISPDFLAPYLFYTVVYTFCFGFKCYLKYTLSC